MNPVTDPGTCEGCILLARALDLACALKPECPVEHFEQTADLTALLNCNTRCDEMTSAGIGADKASAICWRLYWEQEAAKEAEDAHSDTAQAD